MNVLKHMESLFLVAALVVGVSTYASAESYKAQVRADAMVSVGSEKMAIVKVTGKRLPSATKFG
jgi:protein subunit release factor A